MIKWTLKEIPIKDLKDHKKNPREINKDQLERLQCNMEKFGLIDKPIVNLDMTIIGGHQRIRIVKRSKGKAKKIECWLPDRELSEKEVDELCISLNLHQGDWDWDCLANMWEPLDLLEYGFSEEKLLGTCEKAEKVLSRSSEEEKEESKKKMKMCPNCGHEF